MSLLELFCHVDDFCQAFYSHWQAKLVTPGVKTRARKHRLSPSEIMTLVIHFHQSHYRDFKAFYTEHVKKQLRSEFPGLVSYNRSVEFMPSVLIPLCAYLRSCQGKCTGISFIDSTDLSVCHNPRIAQHEVFKGLAMRGKTSTGWFFRVEAPDSSWIGI